jgi:tetratricopeptide (TPR) repeat protein
MQEATGLGNLGTQYIGLGLYKQARSLLEQEIAIAQALGSRRSLSYGRGNLADSFLATGDLRRARQLEEQALQDIIPTQDMRGRIGITIDLGMVLLAIGDATGAASRFMNARELALSQGDTPRLCEATAGLASCAIMQGELDQARTYIQEAWGYLKEHGWIGTGNTARIYRSCAETFDALGDEENLQAALEAGYKVFMDTADKINVPAWRQSFLENVPDVRIIMEMWERRKIK